MSKNIDLNNTIAKIKDFISLSLKKSGLNGYVIGLSGGIDSALSASLAIEAVGKDKVFGLIMPYRTSSDNSEKDAMALIEKTGIEYQKIEISPMIDAYYNRIDEHNRLRAGNKMARERMSVLFDVAHEKNLMVLGTGNRTEICLGYTTWYGDSACSINPIGELYKTEVRQIARILGVPDQIIIKAPSADLWAGQTDEGEIGVLYEMIDLILGSIIDDGITSRKELKDLCYSENDIKQVVKLLNKNAFKRSLPEIADLGRNIIPPSITLKD
ncbi:MAG: NAD+ synthase [bacterium]